jgi:DNA/RNA endonuclease G (NUC1)
MTFRRYSVLLLLCLTFVAQIASAAAFTPGNIVIYRVGATGGATALSSAAAPVFLDEYTPAGTLVQTIAMPTAVNGANKRLTASGNSTTEGFLTLSANGLYLVMAGYDADTGTAAVPGTTSATVARVMGRVDGSGNVDTTTAIGDSFSGGNPRSVASNDGTGFWTVGSANGVRYSTLGATTSTSVSTTNTNLRQVAIFNGQLYITSGAGSIRLGAVGTGLPTSTVTTTSLPGMPTATNSFNGVFFADLSASVAGVDTVYLADDGTNTLAKYSLVSGSWTSNGTIAVSGARGLCGSVSGTSVSLFGTSGATGTTLYKFVDNSGYNAALTGSVTNIATASTNTAFRGVSNAPSGGVNPQPTNPTGAGAANPNNVLIGGSTLLTVTVTPGANPTSTSIAVSANLSSIGGSATQAFFNDGTNGDATANDSTFSFTATIGGATTAGAKSLPFSISDAQSRSGSGNISLTVTQPGPLSVTGSATPSTVGAGSQTLLTATVTPGNNPTSSGIAVQANLSSIGGSSTQQFFNDGTNGDATANDNIYSYRATLADNTSAGGKSLAVTASDAQSRTASTSISLTVSAPTPISVSGSATPSTLVAGSQTLLTATVTAGTNPVSTGVLVTGNLTSIGGSSSQQFFNDGTNGDVTANDNIYSYLASVPIFTSTGSKSIAVSASDAQSRTASATITVNVVAPSTHVTISQLYGGGGNSGATYNHDFVELYNPTNATVDLTGWSVQYASSAGTSWQTQIIGGTIGAGEYYLISLGTGNVAVGAPLPAANVNGSINMSGTTGKVALSNSPEPLDGGCPVGGPTVIDFIGYGGADCREGISGNAPTPSNSTADFRRNGGAVDTDTNGADFSTGTPNPRRTAPIVEFGPIVVSVDPRANNTIAPHDASITVNFSEAVNLDAGWYSISCASTGSHNDATTANTADHMTFTATPNVSFAPGEQCTATVFRDHVHDVDSDDSGVNDDNLPADKTWSFTVSSNTTPPPYSSDVHLTMGNPSNAQTDLLLPNNYLMMKPTYALSYNRDKGTPNWVSWHLETAWYGSLARIDTFRPDPQVPADWYRVQAFDFASTGFDRGHMTPNADRDHQDRIPINQETYLMSNMVPQSPDNNQGPWANLEGYLRTQADAGSEIYIVSGPSGQGGAGSNGAMSTVAGGHVVVPSQTWKVALFLPKQDGNDVARVAASTRTLAVIMPNIQGIRNVDWNTYVTTVDQVESLTGYNFFSNVPAAIQNAIEAGTNGVNPPGAGNQSVSTREDNDKTFTLDAASPNSNALTYTIVSGPSHGSLSGTNGNETYTPAPDFNGTDTFTWNASDGTRTSNTATVTISVLEVNDAPTATADSKSTDEDTALTFAASDLTANDSTGPSNESSQTLTVTSVSSTVDTHGSVALDGGNVTYTPAPNYNGSASFTYQVCDNGFTAGLSDSLCTTSTVNVTVNSINDGPTASNDSATTDEDTPVTIDVLANDTDADNDSLTITAVSTPSHGGAVISNGKLVYTPNANYNGGDSFTYTITDGQLSATATVNVTVSSVNDAPSATNDSATTDEDTAVTINVLANDSDADNDSLTITAVSAPSHGGAAISNGKVVYTPNANYNGGDSFTYTITDGQLSATATVNVTVSSVNDAPSAYIVAPSTGSEGTQISVSGSATDPDADETFTFSWVVTKSGSPYATGSGTPFSFTPDDNGTYVVTLTATDSHNGSGSTSASIAVSNVAPSIGSVTGPTAPLPLGNSATITVTYSDPGTADTHTATLTWDDGSNSTVACSAGTCSASHTYANAGVYGVAITVADDDGGKATSRFEYVVVYDPSSGFVTGAGTIVSPAGAYVAKPELTGKATFGFVSKYQKGQSTPTGDTAFQFDVASFSFASTSYDWLVIAGSKAQYKGTGKVNGAGNYGFLLTGNDGDVTNGGKGIDKFRIKIWDKTTGLTVYDNVLGASDDIDAANPQQIATGNITIHSSK